MIELTKLNENKFILNAGLIETIEETPDTVITLVSGKKIIVKEVDKGEKSSKIVRKEIFQYH